MALGVAEMLSLRQWSRALTSSYMCEKCRQTLLMASGTWEERRETDVNRRRGLVWRPLCCLCLNGGGLALL
jgi:hypothetical protein